MLHSTSGPITTPGRAPHVASNTHFLKAPAHFLEPPAHFLEAPAHFLSGSVASNAPHSASGAPHSASGAHDNVYSVRNVPISCSDDATSPKTTPPEAGRTSLVPNTPIKEPRRNRVRDESGKLLNCSRDIDLPAIHGPKTLP